MPAAGHALSANLHGGHGPLSLPHRTGDAFSAAHQIRVGSVCSGMGTCAHALNLVKAANPELHAHVAFFVELNRHCQEVLAADFPGVTVYDDLSDWCSELPGCDVLCAGFPCQPYSQANRRRKGSADPRAGVVDDLLAYIARVKPLVVALENVVGLLSFGRDVLRKICTQLQDCGYQVALQKLSGHTHGGVPQKRRRLYIVGIIEPMRPVPWPRPIPAIRLSSILKTDYQPQSELPSARKAALKVRIAEGALEMVGSTTEAELAEAVVNCHAQSGKLFLGGHTPCLTAARGAQGGFWLLAQHRMMSTAELLHLQGVPASKSCLGGARPPVSKRQAGKMIGNAFTMTVFARVLAAALASAGLEVMDPFADLAAPQEEEQRRKQRRTRLSSRDGKLRRPR